MPCTIVIQIKFTGLGALSILRPENPRTGSSRTVISSSECFELQAGIEPNQAVNARQGCQETHTTCEFVICLTQVISADDFVQVKASWNFVGFFVQVLHV